MLAATGQHRRGTSWLASIVSISIICGSLLATIGQLGADTTAPPNQAAHLQNVNSYLAQFLDTSTEPNNAIIKHKLNDAIRAIEAAKSHSLNEDEAATKRLSELLAASAGEPTRYLATLRNLIQSIESCDLGSVEFLIEILDLYAKTNSQGQILQLFASNRLQDCWLQQVKLVAKRVNLGLGKMSVPIFETIHSIASILIKKYEVKEQRQSGSIVINTDEKADIIPKPNLDEIYKPEMVAKLGLIHLDQSDQRRQVGRAMKKLFDRIHGEDPINYFGRRQRVPQFKEFVKQSLVEPCAEVIERFKNALLGTKQFGRYVQQTLGNALTSLASQENQNYLNHDLEIFRICHFVENGKQLENELADYLMEIYDK